MRLFQVIPFLLILMGLISSSYSRELVRPGKGQTISRIIELDQFGLNVSDVMYQFKSKYVKKYFVEQDESFQTFNTILKNFQKRPPKGDVVKSAKKKKGFMELLITVTVDQNEIEDHELQEGTNLQTREVKIHYHVNNENNGNIRVKSEFKYGFVNTRLIKLIATFGGGRKYALPKYTQITIVPMLKENAIRLDMKLNPMIPVYKDIYESFFKTFADSCEHTFEHYILNDIKSQG